MNPSNDRVMVPPSRTVRLRSHVPAQPGVVKLEYPPLPRRVPVWRPPPLNAGKFRRPAAPCYHYCSGAALQAFLAADAIQPELSPATEFLPAMSLTWCSTARHWEPYAPVAGQLGIEDRCDLYHREPGEVARIAVQPDAVAPWDDYLVAGGLNDLWLLHFAQCGLEWGARPDNWYLTAHPIPARQWLRVQVWDGGAWATYKPAPVPATA